MNKPIFAVDVDLTTVDTLSSWVEWYESLTNLSFPWDRLGEKSAFKLMKENISHPISYWEKEDLYDNLVPLEGSIEALENISLDYRIVFVTKSTAGHMYSKVNFLDKYFPFHSGIMHTSEKGLVEAEVFIDDFNKYIHTIQSQRPQAKILFMRNKANAHEVIDGVTNVYNWGDVNVHFTRSLNRGR